MLNLAMAAAGAMLLLCFNIEDQLWAHFITIWTVCNGFLALFSLIPMNLRRNGRLQPNDANLFIQALRYSDLEVQAFVDEAAMVREMAHGPETMGAKSVDDLLACYDANSAQLACLWMAVNRMHAQNDPRFGPYCLKLIEHPRLPADEALRQIDIYLTHFLNIGPPEDMEASDRLSQVLVEDSPSITTRGTRGSVLIDLGRLEEGRALLEDVLKKTDSSIDKIYASAFLALAAKVDGDLAKAHEYAHTAARLDPLNPVLKRLVDLLPATAGG
jgi:hypothetical protein